MYNYDPKCTILLIRIIIIMINKKKKYYTQLQDCMLWY